MPEQPELDALADFLRGSLVGDTIAEAHLGEISALKSARRPLDSLLGQHVTAISRVGKFLDIAVGDGHLIVHFALMGWLRWYAEATRGPVRMGKGPLALRIALESGAGFDLTEQGTKKSLAIHLVSRPDEVERIAQLGTDVSEVNEDEFTRILAGSPARIKTLLRDQSLIAGIGNRWSDEILHTAKLSPFATSARISDPRALHAAMRTVLDRATAELSGLPPGKIKAAEKRLSAVHGKAGTPCPVCQATIAEVVFSDRSFQYCPGCQTGGKRLNDRRLDRLLK
ncbi:DNA-(apurinic or apyrimidinic site) lyase /formamidopyrimidine-DNA glycosylase [Brevibacterium sanguinis]|uniref:DNA-(Apurinic or apyrimidinic site) lyase /formamidopyrimidine-DNA glycosylase n=2 Tax=Brevibacterium TaxID=1696 RepID=A0A366IN15_9MICO|nr:MULTISPECIES: DNA-formamidopyrimidine glycosylase family protein [Brevibacterium]RBP66225.1 DNA-(apurinic or apyrimidinic site) lyase /formamidopyrimidine-DNA glycosylase [Brevibacterium sanguinis]RBP72876.1 DNA-(apurinic or apyrimidinic site) lyase /formamidopyrimidine-DNA glycosylase [Brevibacterium celere]